MIAPLRSFRSGIALLVLALAAATAAQSDDSGASGAAAAAAPAPAMDTETSPFYDVLQFAPDEAFIDLRASLADTWSATLGVLAELRYPINTDLAYLDVGGQIELADLWVAVEPHVSRNESFTRVRIALDGASDPEYLQARAEVVLDAVANRLSPVPVIHEVKNVVEPIIPATTTVHETTYVPYYVSYPVPYCSPYYLPYYSSYSCLHYASWWNNCWYAGGPLWSPWHHNGLFFGFHHGGWQWGFSSYWGNTCSGYGSAWSWPSWGWWSGPGCSSWHVPACASGLVPCGGNAGPGGLVFADDLVDDTTAPDPHGGFDFHRTAVDGDIAHTPRPHIFVDAPDGDRPTTHVTSRARRDVPTAERRPHIVVTRTEPLPSHTRRSSTAPSGTRSPTIVVTSGGSSVPRAGSVVRLPSANYDSRTAQMPSGHVSTTFQPRNNPGPVSSVPQAYGGSGDSGSSSASGSSRTSSSHSSRSDSGNAPSSMPTQVPIYGSPEASSRGAAPVASTPSTPTGSRSSDRSSSSGSQATRSTPPAAQAPTPAPSRSSAAPAPAPSAPATGRASGSSGSAGSSGSHSSHGKGRP